MATDDRNQYRGHAYTIDRRGKWRTIEVPSLGVEDYVFDRTLKQAHQAARWLIDLHIAEHGDATVERKPLTDEERAADNEEVFGGF